MDSIEAYLDAADEVLNSNTFLVRVPLTAADIKTDIRTFIASGELQQALTTAAIARGWYNLHRITVAGDPTPVPGSLAKPEFRLTWRQPTFTAGEYLQAMLRGDGRLGNFFSFYSCAKNPAEARRLTGALLSQLFHGLDPVLCLIEPDFFVEAPQDADQLYYFEGNGCDNAVLLVGGSIAYLLLTNGTP
jgi:hypothetical protein